MSVDRLAAPAAERYLAELEAALKLTPGVVPAETLADAREFIDAELHLLDGRVPDDYMFDWLVERFGRPKDVAAAYAAGEPPVPRLPGYAPGWRVECVRCGRSAPASRVGFVRIGARSRGKFVLGWCRRCRFFAVLRVVQDLPRDA